MKLYETFEHRADIGVRGYGKSREEAFENGAKAMFSVMVDIAGVNPVDTEEISCEAPDTETLFVEWLNNLLSAAHLSGKLFSGFKVWITDNSLKGIATGERIDRNRHHIMTEVKGATYSALKVEKKDDVYVVQCIVDV